MPQSVQMQDSDPTVALEQMTKDHLRALRCYPRKPEDVHID